MHKTNTLPKLYFRVVQAEINHQYGIAAQEKQG